MHSCGGHLGEWQVDEDKLTFIIHARRPLSESPAAEEPSPEMRWDWDALCAMPMVGDVNLFLKESPEDEFFEAEAEIMIAALCYSSRAYKAMTT